MISEQEFFLFNSDFFFILQISVLGKVRHPNIITLIGSCPEASTLVYEYLPNGNLEDRLNCKGNTPPLSWQLRTKIISEVCSALIFLHSAKPHPIVHGDLKPDNILLDSNFVSKTSDFGIARLLRASSRTSAFHRTNPKGTYGYIDPDFIATGELTPQSDVYSLGIIILRLLTKKPVLNIVEHVGAASDKDFMAMIDLSAGSWPFVHAKKLAYIGLRCTKICRKSRSNLMKDVWPGIEALLTAAMAPTSPCCKSIADENHAPSYFFCPIVQVKCDPVSLYIMLVVYDVTLYLSPSVSSFGDHFSRNDNKRLLLLQFNFHQQS